MSEHTPGPWHALKSEKWRTWQPNQPSSICHIGDWTIVTQSPSYEFHAGDETDARLIAAAPDLLAAAKEAFEMSPFHSEGCKGVTVYEKDMIFDNRVGCDCYLGRLRAAIAKATGREDREAG